MEQRTVNVIREDSSDAAHRRQAEAGRPPDNDIASEQYYLATQRQLIWRAFKRHKLAVVSSILLATLYVTMAFAEFISPNEPYFRFQGAIHHPPTPIHLFHEGRLVGPFVYRYEQTLDMQTLRRNYDEDRTEPHRIRLFVRSEPYEMWGFVPLSVRLFGVRDPGRLFLFGADELGRDMFSRITAASRISLSIGLVGVILSFLLGATLGSISGYFGGATDTVIQRIIEFLRSIPTIPLWMGFAAAIPHGWSNEGRYFAITVILSLVAWTSLARVVRGKFLELRQAEFVLAARLAGATDRRIIVSHMFPGFLSYLIVNATLAIPNMILAETSLSFLGLGLRRPVLSWGVLLQDAQNVRTVAVHPWLMIPVLFVIATVLLFNFVGDGLRDAADPYKSR